MSVMDNAAFHWNGYEVYPVGQSVVPNGLNHVIRGAPQAATQGNLVLPMAVTYPAPQVAIPNVGYIHPVNVIRPCWSRPVATNADTRLHGMCTVQPAAMHKQTGAILPQGVSTAGAASTVGNHSASSLPPSSACAPRSDGFLLNQAAADTVSPSVSCHQDSSRYHAMKSEDGARGVCQVSERAPLPAVAPALVPIVPTHVDASQPAQPGGTSPPKPVLMSLDSLSALNIATAPYSAFRGGVGLTLRHRSPSLGHSLSSIPLASSLGQLWASQNQLLTPLSSINSVSNLKTEVKFPTLEAQYYGGSLPDLSLGTLQRLLPSTPNVAGSNSELHRGASGLLYLIPSQAHLPVKPVDAASAENDDYGSGNNSPNQANVSSLAPGQWLPRCTVLSSSVGGRGTERPATMQTLSPSSTSPHSVLSHRSPVSLPSPPLSPEGVDPPPNLSEITQFKIVSPESSVAQSCSLSPPNCRSPVAQPILQPVLPPHTLSPFSATQEPVDCSTRVSLPVNGNLPFVYSGCRPQPVALPPYNTVISSRQQIRQNDFSAEDAEGLPLEKKFRLNHEPSMMAADYDTHAGSPGSDHLMFSMHNGEGLKKEKPHMCDYPNCGRSFTFPAHLKSHIQQTHICHRPCECDFEGCGKRFYTPQHLTVHRRVHTGERPFVCPYENCRKAFTTAGNLKNHIRTHTGERPYACKYATCERKFAEMSSLRKHELTHTGEKPYACRMCNKKFSQAGSRNTHERRHNKAQSQADSPTK